MGELTLGEGGLGLTVTVKVIGVPLHPAEFVGVTVIVAIPELVEVKEVMLPVPLDFNPIAVLSFVQLNIVPDVLLVNAGIFIIAPLHTAWLGMGFTSGGFDTVIVFVIVSLPHPF